MISHHPESEMLFDYASGGLEEEPSLAVASHLVFCALCRNEVRSMETLGGALLADAGSAEMSDGALDDVMTRLDSDIPPEPAVSRPTEGFDPVLPGPLRRYIGTGLEGLRWRRIGPRVEEARIAGANPKFKTSLLRIKPGMKIPGHTHDGQEYTLVLKGGIIDGADHYRRGDIMRGDSDHEHKPIAADDEECICLVVLDAPVRFTGLFTRLLNPFLGGAKSY
jgi:putative transcriptional regulator